MNKVKFLIIIAAAILTQCTENAPQVYRLNEPLDVAQGQSITLTLDDPSKRIDLMVLEISEARCPSDVQCVRFGEAEVTVGINGNEEVLQTIDLCIGDCPDRNSGVIVADTAQVELDGENYALILNDVVPYPNTTNGNIPKRALLRVIPG